MCDRLGYLRDMGWKFALFDGVEMTGKRGGLVNPT